MGFPDSNQNVLGSRIKFYPRYSRWGLEVLSTNMLQKNLAHP